MRGGGGGVRTSSRGWESAEGYDRDTIDDEGFAEEHRRVYPDKRVYLWRGYRDEYAEMRCRRQEYISTTRSKTVTAVMTHAMSIQCKRDNDISTRSDAAQKAPAVLLRL